MNYQPLQAETFTSAAEMARAYAARRARLTGSGNVINLASRKPTPTKTPIERPPEPADAHIRAYEDYLAQLAECPSPSAYVRLRCKVLGIDHSTLISRDRSSDMVAARHMLIREVKARYPNLSTTQIGWLFERDHSLVLYALSAGTPKPKRPCLPEERIRLIRAMHAKGMAVNAICKATGHSRDAVGRYAIPGKAEEIMRRKREQRRKARAE